MSLFFVFGSDAQAVTASTSTTATIVAPAGIGLLNELKLIIPGTTQTGTVIANPATRQGNTGQLNLRSHTV